MSGTISSRLKLLGDINNVVICPKGCYLCSTTRAVSCHVTMKIRDALLNKFFVVCEKQIFVCYDYQN